MILYDCIFSFFVWQINSIDFQLVVYDHVVEYNHVIPWYRHQDERRGRGAVDSWVSTSGTSWIYEILSVVLLNTEFVGMPMDKHVNIKFSLNSCQSFQISPGCYLMAVNNSYLNVTYLNNFCLREVAKIVEFSSDCMHLWLSGGKGFKPFLYLCFIFFILDNIIKNLPPCFQGYQGWGHTAFCLVKEAP